MTPKIRKIQVYSHALNKYKKRFKIISKKNQYITPTIINQIQRSKIVWSNRCKFINRKNWTSRYNTNPYNTQI